jgi:hypothetical protein
MVLGLLCVIGTSPFLAQSIAIFESLGFRVLGLPLIGVLGLGFRSPFGVGRSVGFTLCLESKFRVQSVGFTLVKGLGFRVQSVGFTLRNRHQRPSWLEAKSFAMKSTESCLSFSCQERSSSSAISSWLLGSGQRHRLKQKSSETTLAPLMRHDALRYTGCRV